MITPKPMNAADVSRLLGRATFGASAADLDLWTGKDYGDLVESIVATSAHPSPLPLPDEPARVELAENPDTNIVEARTWWLERMRTTPFPLLERMTLLWHGHFATAVSLPPSVQEVLKQNQTLRTNALGNFRTMVEQITVDPAMLFWLNGYKNEIPNPNENYAREFFELFTLGKRPQVYTENDIRAAARAFTGWYVDSTGAAAFAASRHDKRPKRILGKSIGNLGADEYKKLVDIALDEPAATRFIAFKLVANLCYVPNSHNLIKDPDPLVYRVAAKLRSTDWDLAAAVRTLLLSDEFRYASPAHGRQVVRQPVECVVHAARALLVPCKDAKLLTALNGMGQSLFNPVNVGGWPLGRNWVSPVTTLARYDAGLAFHRLATADPVRTALQLPAADDLAGWTRKLGLSGLSPNTTNALKGYLRRTSGASAADRQCGVLTLLLCSPEWVVI